MGHPSIFVQVQNGNGVMNALLDHTTTIPDLRLLSSNSIYLTWPTIRPPDPKTQDHIERGPYDPNSWGPFLKESKSLMS